MKREEALRQIATEEPWDIVVIGGGSSGLGAALEAAARGYRTLLLEQEDFAKGTSSRSTKLVHGGVRYLQQGNLALVLEALEERGRMLRNAPHLVHRLAFVIPAISRLAVPFYGIGLKIYDAMAGRGSFGRSIILSAAETRQRLPGLPLQDIRGGICYYDGQFDDARMAVTLTQTLFDQGGYALNYARVTRLLQHNGRIAGVAAIDTESGQEFEVTARVVINATGIFSDAIRAFDEPNASPMLTISQGSHIVLQRSFLPGADALMIPRTVDGRVLFAIPWHEAVIVGTTDVPVPGAQLEPRPLAVERGFLLDQIVRYMGRRPEPHEVLSEWSGQRPLVRRQGAARTAALSREHTVTVSSHGLVTVLGGKWTTYRRMGEDTINRAAQSANLPRRSSPTADLRLHGWTAEVSSISDPMQVYGADRAAVEAVMHERPELEALLHPSLPYRAAEIVWAARQEMARTVEDALARRTRALFLNARAAMEAAPATAALLASELGRDAKWMKEQVANFANLAHGYIFGSS
jgi:glycerol-3-phosphate dehydrogenase